MGKAELLIISTLAKKDARLQGTLKRLKCKEDVLIDTNEYEIRQCSGCTNCWLKTPGICSLKDDYEKIYKRFLKADTILLVTEAKKGFISYRMKNVVDRLLPLAVPYTKFYNGETRHIARYEKTWNVGLAYDGEGDKGYLNEWMERFTLNFHSCSLGAMQIGEGGFLNELSNI